jgi:hypothetical protein
MRKISLIKLLFIVMAVNKNGSPNLYLNKKSSVYSSTPNFATPVKVLEGPKIPYLSTSPVNKDIGMRPYKPSVSPLTADKSNRNAHRKKPTIDDL